MRQKVILKLTPNENGYNETVKFSITLHETESLK